MTFNPFGDFQSRGYLRNLAQEKDPAIVRRLEHASFTTGIDDAFEALKKKKALTYADVLSTHNTLFEAMYLWAGQERTQTAPNIAVSRGSILFAHPKYIQNAIEHALKLGNDLSEFQIRCPLGAVCCSADAASVIPRFPGGPREALGVRGRTTPAETE